MPAGLKRRVAAHYSWVGDSSPVLSYLLTAHYSPATNEFADRLERTQTQDPPSKTEDGAPSVKLRVRATRPFQIHSRLPPASLNQSTTDICHSLSNRCIRNLLRLHVVPDGGREWYVSTVEGCSAGLFVHDAARMGAWRAGDLFDCGLRREDAGVRRGGADEQFGGRG